MKRLESSSWREPIINTLWHSPSRPLMRGWSGNASSIWAFCGPAATTARRANGFTARSILPKRWPIPGSRLRASIAWAIGSCTPDGSQRAYKPTSRPCTYLRRSRIPEEWRKRSTCLAPRTVLLETWSPPCRSLGRLLNCFGTQGISPVSPRVFPCVQEAAEALHLSRQITSPGAEAWALLILGYVLAHFGEFGSALAHAQQACRIATEIGHRQWAAAAHCTLGVTYLLQLEPSCARDALETGIALAREGGSTWWMIQTTILLARVYLLQNELEQAEAALAAVLPREQRPR